MSERVVRYSLVLLSLLGAVSSSYSGLALMCVTFTTCYLLSRRCCESSLDYGYGAIIGSILVLSPLLCGAAGVLSSLSIVLLFLPWSNVRWFSPVALVVATWASVDAVMFAGAVVHSGPHILGAYSSEEIIRWVRLSLEVAPPRVLFELQTLHGVLIFGVLFTVIGERAVLRTSAATVVTGLLPISLLVGLLQRTDLLQGTPLSSAPFWREQGRVSGLFTDPNAAGIGAILVIALLLFIPPKCSSWVKALLTGAAIVLGLLSGSRTFLLGAAALIFLLLWRWKRKAAILGALLTVASLVGFVFFALHFEESARAFVALFPTSVTRALQTFQPELFEWSSLSRRAFWDISFAIAKDNLIAGVGPSSFRESVTPYARMLGYPIGLWTDNANSFYLGILAETGLLGVAAWVLAISSLTRAPYALGRSAVAAPLVALLLVTGPHTDFVEIGALIVLVLGSSLRPGEGRLKLNFLSVTCAIFTVLIVITHAVYREQGTYAYEPNGAVGYLRWIAPHSKVYAPCNSHGEAHISIRAHHEESSGAPVHVTIHGFSAPIIIQALAGQWYPVTVRCFPESISETVSWHPRRVLLTVDTSKGWSPILRGQGNDPRYLGVQVSSEG